MEGGARLRAQLVVLGVLVLFAALGARAYYLCVVQHEHYRTIADRQQTRRVDEAPLRGAIYDREGRLMAVSRLVPSLFANPRKIADARLAARTLAPLLGKSEAFLLRRLMARKRHFVWLKRHLEPREARAIKALKIDGLGFRSEPRRYYPHGSVGAHVLGFCGTDQDGLEGLERAWNTQLAGQPGATLELRDARFGLVRRPGAIGSRAEDGRDLHLSLDLVIQRIAEQELAAATAEFRPQRACAIVLESGSCELLALACWPTFDPNRFGASPKTAWRNSAIADVFEPGSTIKPIVAAYGLQERLFTLDSIIDCHNGRWRYRGRTLHDHRGRGKLTVAEVVIYSSNIGMAQIGLALGKQRLRRYLEAVGFGRRPSALRVRGASPGKLTPPRRWTYYSTTSVTMGHEMLCSPLQLAVAVNVLAGDGLWAPARLVRATSRPGGPPEPVARRLSTERVLSRRVAGQMRGVMGRVVSEGTGKRAKLAHVTVGGKTGTAQKVMPDGTYSHSRYVSSFVGFAPVDRPRITVFVLLDDPVSENGKPYGGRVAAPAAAAIIKRTLAYLGGRL